MRFCLKCANEFTFKDRLKSMFKHPFVTRLECSKCGTVYKPKRTLHRFIYNFTILMLSTNLQIILMLLINGYEPNKTVLIIQIIIPIVFLLSYDLISHKYQKYEILNDEK